jgi:hypothetical protein
MLLVVEAGDDDVDDLARSRLPDPCTTLHDCPAGCVAHRHGVFRAGPLTARKGEGAVLTQGQIIGAAVLQRRSCLPGPRSCRRWCASAGLRIPGHAGREYQTRRQQTARPPGRSRFHRFTWVMLRRGCRRCVRAAPTVRLAYSAGRLRAKPVKRSRQPTGAVSFTWGVVAHAGVGSSGGAVVGEIGRRVLGLLARLSLARLCAAPAAVPFQKQTPPPRWAAFRRGRRPERPRRASTSGPLSSCGERAASWPARTPEAAASASGAPFFLRVDGFLVAAFFLASSRRRRTQGLDFSRAIDPAPSAPCRHCHRRDWPCAGCACSRPGAP